MSDPRIEAILKVMRNGRERHSLEIREALERDHEISVNGNVLGALLSATPGVRNTGEIQAPTRDGLTRCSTWRLER